MAGIGDQCSNRGVKQFTELLGNFSGTEGYCMYACIKYDPIQFLWTLWCICIDLIIDQKIASIQLNKSLCKKKINHD